MQSAEHHLKVTFVIDPRRSLMAGTVWLVVALAASFACAASLWVGSLARDNVLQQHERRLALETEQLAFDLGQSIRMREGAVHAAERLVRRGEPAASGGARPAPDAELRMIWAELEALYGELDWIALADARGQLLAADRSGGTAALPADGVAAAPWFLQGSRRPWIGVIRTSDVGIDAGGDIAIPVHAADGELLGVIAARLAWTSVPHHVERLYEATEPRDSAQVYVVDGDGRVLVGPPSARDRPWPGVPTDPATVSVEPTAGGALPSFERLPDAGIVLVARAALRAPSTLPGTAEQADPPWQVRVAEPEERVFQRADALGLRIWGISIALGAMTAVLGALGARRLTRRLAALTESAAAVGRDERQTIDVPAGQDEAARLARAFAGVLEDLRRERSELRAVSDELERRVIVRTREVERLAEESRYAAIGRERLKIARDLHDTLAHSMMAMLSEIRLLRRLQAQDPAALAEELDRAEQVAQDGLNEARSAIAQMRLGSVRDVGLGAALAQAAQRFMDHTGIEVLYTADPGVARVGDERAETLFRMAEEALRNVERHAQASQVVITLTPRGDTQLELRIRDDGVGFDVGAAHPGHYGLVGLREQAQLIGADLVIDSAAGRGTTVTLSLRMTPEDL
jgi:signal transduction histidine kinase